MINELTLTFTQFFCTIGLFVWCGALVGYIFYDVSEIERDLKQRRQS